jgi:hypothetical protein
MADGLGGAAGRGRLGGEPGLMLKLAIPEFGAVGFVGELGSLNFPFSAATEREVNDTMLDLNFELSTHSDRGEPAQLIRHPSRCLHQ